VDELGAELYGGGEAGFVSGPRASADVVPGLQHEDGQARLAQLTGCGQSGDAGTDNDNVP